MLPGHADDVVSVSFENLLSQDQVNGIVFNTENQGLLADDLQSAGGQLRQSDSRPEEKTDEVGGDSAPEPSFSSLVAAPVNTAKTVRHRT